jgi:hypothetical protein
MLDSLEVVCAGQARFEYPATFVLFSKCSSTAELRFPDALRDPLTPHQSFSQLHPHGLLYTTIHLDICPRPSS